MQDEEFQFLTSILASCEPRKECDASDPSGVRCENYYLCFPKEATPEIKKQQADRIKRFKKDMRKLEKASEFLEGILEELHKVL
jgi:hypothetical protein